MMVVWMAAIKVGQTVDLKASMQVVWKDVKWDVRKAGKLVRLSASM